MCSEEDFCLETYKTKPTYRECCRCGEIATLGFGEGKRTRNNPEAVKFWLCQECADIYVSKNGNSSSA